MIGRSIAMADMALLALAPLAGVAIHRFVGNYEGTLSEVNDAVTSRAAWPILMPIGLSLAVALWLIAFRDGVALWLGACLGWSLVALALADLRYRLLPNRLTMPLAAIGLVIAGLRARGVPVDELVGLVVGFGGFAAIGGLYRLWRGRDGLGLGDAKLMAAAGAWLGWAQLPAVVLLACIAALAAVGLAALRGRRTALNEELAFGPYLCAAIWLVWLYAPAAFH